MATVTYIAFSQGFGTSFSGTVNLGQGFSAAVAQVALNSIYVPPPDSDYCEVYLSGYTINGDPFPLSNNLGGIRQGAVGINGAVDSFSWSGGTGGGGTGFVNAWITICCFQ
jgi:hypothetical protein